MAGHWQHLFSFSHPRFILTMSPCRSSESNCREFHVATLPYKPDFKVMPEDWDGMPKDLDEVHYEISKKEDEMLYEDFVQKFEFNMRKVSFI